MSGQRASDVDIHGSGTATSSRRVPVIAVAAAVLSVALCGAVAQASSTPDVQAGAGKLVHVGSDTHKAVGAPSSSDVVASEPEGQPVPPDDLGGDPQLDELATACFEGDLLACDRLYLQSPVDSDYEEYGDTCGGRQSAGTGRYCALGADDDGTTASTDAPVDTATTASTDAPIDTSIDTAPDTSIGASIDTVANTSTEVSTVPEPVPPDGLGSDPALDALADGCYAGDMEVCDELYASADAGSDYEVYGDTCAGRQPPNTGSYCTALEDPVAGSVVTESTDLTVESSPPLVTEPSSEPTLPVPGEVPAPTLEPTGLGNDPTLDGLAQSCYDGDLVACDDLYEGSEPDTPYRIFGDTCAGRQPEGSGTWCVDAFGAGASPTEPPGTVTETVAPTLPSTTVLTSPATTVPVPVPPSTGPTVAVTTVVPGESTTTIPGVVPPPTIQPTGLGADPALDELAQFCFDGDLQACDDLWRDSQEGTSYHDYGDTCAGRQPLGTGTWCIDAFAGGAATTTTTVLAGPTSSVSVTTAPLPATSSTVITSTGVPPATQQPTGLGDDPALDALAQACFDGVMQSCDDLFDTAPIGSAYMSYGDTCAGRQEPGTLNYCRVRFPTT